jgi:CBS domain-containing protein
LEGVAMLVQQILKSKGDDGVITVTPDTPIAEAASILAERRIGGLVVSADGEAADGILSERDIVRALAVRGASCLTETVSEMMTRNPVCCARQDTSDAVLARMTDGRFRHMPVVEEGKLVGIVTIGDVVKARLDELSLEKTALEGMIMGY